MSQAAHKQLDQSLPGLFVKQDDLSLKYVLRLSIIMLSLSAHDLALIECLHHRSNLREYSSYQTDLCLSFWESSTDSTSFSIYLFLFLFFYLWD